MKTTRCTCMYRPSTLAERDDGQPAIIVVANDPWCPAAAAHERGRQTGRAVTVDLER